MVAILKRLTGLAALATVIAPASLVWPSVAQAEEVLAVKFPGGVVQECSPPAAGRFTVQGPGSVTISVTLIPYKSLGTIANIPITYRQLSPEPRPDFAPGHPLPGFERDRFTQAGKEVGNFTDGVPLVKESFYKLDDAKQYVVEVHASSPDCHMMPQRPYWQEGQETHVAVTAAGGATVTTTPSTGGAVTDGGETTTDGHEATDCGQEQRLFDNGNLANVQNQPTQPTIFTLDRSAGITTIRTYHWNDHRGATPGTITLKGDSGETYDLWQATGEPGMGGLPNAYWAVHPNVTLNSGAYTVIDSDPSSWSQDNESGGAGFASIYGCYK